MSATTVSGDFGVTLELATGRAVFTVRGDLDLLTSPGLEAVLAAVLGGDVEVVMDVAEVRFVDATFLNVIAHAAGTLRSSGRTLTLRSPGGFQRRLLEITGLDQVIRIEPPQEGPPVAAELTRAAAEASLDAAVLDASLRLVAHLAQATVRGADGVSVSLAHHDLMQTVAATDAVVSGMDEDQYATGQGPCLETAHGGRAVHVPVLAEEARWPVFVPLARGRGIRSILSTPLRRSDAPVGALNIYSFTDHAFATSEQELAEVFAAGASELLADARPGDPDGQLASRLHDALGARETIAMAQGVLMARAGTSPHEAYRRLLRDSRRTDRPLRDLAADVIATVAGGGAAAPFEESGSR